MKSAAIVLVLVAATACTLTQRETVLLADGVPITVVVSGGQTCIEVGEDADSGWCRRDDMPEAVWMGATSIGGGRVVIGQAPPQVASVDLAGEGGSNTLCRRSTTCENPTQEHPQ